MDEQGIAITTGWPDENGPCTVRITVNGNEMLFTPDEAIAHANCVNMLAMTAEYYAMIMRGVTAKLDDPQMGVKMVARFMQRRGHLDFAALGGDLKFMPNVGLPDYKPYVEVIWGDEKLGAFDMGAIRVHSIAVAESAAVARLDDEFVDYLHREIGLPKDQAISWVSVLSEHRPEFEVGAEIQYQGASS